MRRRWVVGAGRGLQEQEENALDAKQFES